MYLDNAATTFPKPECVYVAMDRYYRAYGGNPGRGSHQLAVESDRVIAQARQRLARLWNVADPARLIFGLNCTHATNQGLKGLLRPGDHVVSTMMEHNAIARPLRRLEDDGVAVTRVAASPLGLVDAADMEAALRPETKLVAMIHGSNVVGALQPIEDVARLCRGRGVRLLVDAAQTAGVFPLDVQAMGIDLLCCSGHKGLLGPTGTGALYVSPELRLRSLIEGGTGTRSEEDIQPTDLPEGLESGTPNTVGLAGLGAALTFLLETGIDAIREHEMRLTVALWEGLSAIAGVTLYGPDPRETPRAPVVSVNVEGWDPNDAAAVLDEQFAIQCRPGLHCAPLAHKSLGTYPHGTIRLSPGFSTTDEECARVVEALRQLAGAA